MNNTREHACHLVDLLPEAQIAGLVRLLETMVDPALAVLGKAPFEDEEIGDMADLVPQPASLNRSII